MEHIYKPTVISRVGVIVAMIVLLVVGMLSAKGQTPNIGAFVFIGAIILFAVGALLIIVTEVVRVSDDGVECSNLFMKRRLPLGEIGGWRVHSINGKNGVSYSLEMQPKDKTLYKPVKISQYIKVDDYFKTWVMQFPNQTTDGGMMGELFHSPQMAKRMENAKFAAGVEALKSSRYNIPADKMVENYFAQSGV